MHFRSFYDEEGWSFVLLWSNPADVEMLGINLIYDHAHQDFILLIPLILHISKVYLKAKLYTYMYIYKNVCCKRF